jgi:hypothetical protein
MTQWSLAQLLSGLHNDIQHKLQTSRVISRLQFSGTVPMIDVQAYGRWLGE